MYHSKLEVCLCHGVPLQHSFSEDRDPHDLLHQSRNTMTDQQLWMDCDTEPYELEEPIKFLDSANEMDSQSNWTFANSLSLHDLVCCTISIECVNDMSQKSGCWKI